MADQNITALPVSDTPASSDQLLLVGATEEKLIDYDKLADAILNKLTSKNFSLDQGTMPLIRALNELNSKAIVTKINTSSDRFKTDFETWFSAQKDGSMHIILLNAGWRSMVIGYKTNSKYGKFIQINYNTSSNAFCTVLEGKITWGV